MRWIVIGIAATLLAVRSEAQVPAPGASEGTIVQAVATGVSVDQADMATVTIALRASGTTKLEATTKVRGLAERLTGELASLGVPRADMDFQDSSTRPAFVGNEAMLSAMEGIEQQALPVKRPAWAMGSLNLTLTDLSLLPRLRQHVETMDEAVMGGPIFQLRDDRRARTAAIADGVRKARADAEAYAAALGMRVTRVLSAQDQAANSMFGATDYTQMFERMSGQPAVKSGMVKTSVDVVVKVAAEPR